MYYALGPKQEVLFARERPEIGRGVWLKGNGEGPLVTILALPTDDAKIRVQSCDPNLEHRSAVEKGYQIVPCRLQRLRGKQIQPLNLIFRLGRRWSGLLGLDDSGRVRRTTTAVFGGPDDEHGLSLIPRALSSAVDAFLAKRSPVVALHKTNVRQSPCVTGPRRPCQPVRAVAYLYSSEPARFATLKLAWNAHHGQGVCRRTLSLSC